MNSIKSIASLTFAVGMLLLISISCTFNQIKLIRNIGNHNEQAQQQYSALNDDLDARKHHSYEPASIEKYLVDNAKSLDFDLETASGCNIWTDETFEKHNSLMSLRTAMANLQEAMGKMEPIPDLLKSIITNGNNDVCSTVRPHPDGMKAFFTNSSDDEPMLSMTSSGFIEPLFPPMRSSTFCLVKNSRPVLMFLDYLIHDFEAMCRNLKPHSKRVLIDLGASLTFTGMRKQPLMNLVSTYEKFGFNFDHIFGFEYDFLDPQVVYKQVLPQKYFKSYHWINVGEET